MLVEYRSQAKNMHNINKISVITIALASLIAAAATDQKSDSGKMSFQALAWKMVVKSEAVAEEKEGFCPSGDIPRDGASPVEES